MRTRRLILRASALMGACLLVVFLAGCGGSAGPIASAGPIPSQGAGAEGRASPGAPSAPSTVTATPAAPAVRVGSVVPEDPADVRLASGVVVAIRAVSTTSNGVLDVPTDIRAAGWWRGGSRIGDPFGSTLVAAHVDSRDQGLGPFADLLSSRVGDEIVVRTQGLVQTFVVSSLELRPKGEISPSSELHSPEGARRLTLVTCAPPFVPSQGSYANLAVVVAEPVGQPVPRGAR